MKTLIIIRHANSIHQGLYESDFERTLSHKGEKEAILMTEKLSIKINSIDLFLCSPSFRTKQTCDIFFKKYERAEIKYEEKLYHASASTIYNVIEKTDESFHTVALISHNPGITDFVNSLTDIKIDTMPTSGVFVVQTNLDTWKQFENSEKTFFYFGYPNKL